MSSPVSAPTPLPAPEALAEIRRAHMTLTEMAGSIGVDKGQLSRFESGKGEMAYAKIRRYVQVLNLRVNETDPARVLAAGLANTRPLQELNVADRVERAVEIIAWNGFSQIPVANAAGSDYAGVLTDAAVCAALAQGDVGDTLAQPVGRLPLESLPQVAPEEVYRRVAEVLSAHPLVLVGSKPGGRVGFATRADLLLVALGKGVAGGRVGSPRRRRGRPRG